MATGQKITIPTSTTMLQGLLPVALAFALSLGAGNLALFYANAHFYEMLSATSVLATVVLGALMGRPQSPKLIPPLMLVTTAIMVVAFGELKFTAIGVMFSVGSVVFRAFKAQCQSMLMTAGTMSQSFDPLELTLWTSLQTWLIILAWSLIAEGLAPWKQFWTMSTVAAVGLSCINAAVLNTAALFVMKEVG